MEHLYKEIDNLSFDDFEQLVQHVDKLRKQRAKNIMLEAQKRASRLMQEVDLASTKPRRASKPPKYRDPTDPNNTWSGYGRQPDWMKNHLEQGGKKEDLLI